MTETVLTTRRAVLLPDAHGRVRVSDRSLRFDPWEGDRVEVAVADLRAVVVRRRVLVVTTADAELRLRCFGVRGVADLLRHARDGTA